MDPSTIENLPLKRNRSTESDDEINAKGENRIQKTNEDKIYHESHSDNKLDLSSDEEFNLIEYLKDKEDDDAENSDQSDEESDEDNDEPDDSENSDDE